MAGVTRSRVGAVVFDLGGVLIDWNPRHLYRRLFDDVAAMEDFLSHVCTVAWNRQHDLGRPFDETVAELAVLFPEHAELIRAFRDRWSEMVAGDIGETVDVLAELRGASVPLYALTNWSAETFPSMRRRFPFLNWFQGVVISGEVGIAKPDVRIFHLLCERYGLEAERLLFVDDSPANVAAARQAGLQGALYTGAGALRSQLLRLGVLPRPLVGSTPAPVSSGNADASPA